MSQTKARAIWTATAFALLLTAGIIVALQQLEIRGLRAELAVLQEQLRQADEQLAADQTATRHPNRPATATENPEEDNHELLRLRSEVTRLQAETDRAKKLESQQAKLQAENSVLKRALDAARTQPIQPSLSSLLPPPESLPRRTGFVGVMLQAGPDGQVLVNGVMPNSPAADAQLKQGDTILKVNGETVTNLVHVRNAIATRQPGQTTLLEILRDGAPLQVYLVPKPPPPEIIDQ